MKSKRLLVLLLSVVMTLCMIPSLAFADVDDEAVWTTEHFTYSGTTVTGFSDAGKALVATTTDVVIPDKTPDGEAVTEIGNSAFAGDYKTKSTITSMKLPSTITSIGNSAFAWGSLTEINLPDGLTSIGTSAFMNNALVSVVMPDSLTTMGDGVFSNNQTLSSVKLSSGLKTITQGCFTSCPIDSIVIPEGVTEIAKNAFKGNGATSISLPSTLTSIGDNAFEEAKITEIEIPGSVKSIGKYAFRIAKSPVKLNKLVLHEGLESIAKQAFKQNAITEVVLPSTVKSLAADAFQDNTSTVKVYYTDAAQAEFGTQTGVKGMELISIETALEQEKENNVLIQFLLQQKTQLENEKSELQKQLEIATDKNTQLENEKLELQKQLEIETARAELLGMSIRTSASSVNYNTIMLSFSAEDVEGFVVDGEDVGAVNSKKFTGLATGKASSHTVKAYRTVNGSKLFTRSFEVSATPVLGTPAVKASGAKKSAAVSWGKVAGAEKYQMSVSRNKAGTSICYSGGKLKHTKGSLKSGKTYYVKVRAYRVQNGKRVYSKWSAVKTVKTK